MDVGTQNHWKMKIKHWGQELGFVAVGFTTADPVNDLAQRLQERLDQEIATPFESKEIRRRIDPRAVWADCQSVVALAYPLPLTAAPQENEGVLARSAVGEDYHRVLQQKIKQLIEMIIRNGWQGMPHWQVDTGPLVERAFAVRAGLGWIGKNQNLIIPGFGSFAALGLLLLDQEIPPDVPILNQCGECQRCVKACPAQIIGNEPFAAKRCVSYLTQSKEVLNADEVQRLGLRIFGCDTCQDVCPHNQKRIEAELVTLTTVHRGVNLLNVLHLTKGEFQQCFKATAAGWRGKNILKRNAFLALRQNAAEADIDALLKHTEGQEMSPMILPYLQ